MKLRTTKKAVNNAKAVKLAFPASHYPLLADLFTPRWYIETRQGLGTTYISPIGSTSYVIITGMQTSGFDAFHADKLPTLAALCKRWEQKLQESVETQSYLENIAEYQNQFERDFRGWVLKTFEMLRNEPELQEYKPC